MCSIEANTPKKHVTIFSAMKICVDSFTSKIPLIAFKERFLSPIVRKQTAANTKAVTAVDLRF